MVRQDYVDEDKVDFRALTYNALRGMLSGLDPHSQFMEPDSFKDMQDDTRSRYDGLGLVVSAKDGVLIVVSTMEDTPASKAGLMGGDQILKINGATTEKMQPERWHGGARTRLEEQSRRPAQQRRGRVRPVPAAAHDGRLHRGSRGLDAARVPDERQRQTAGRLPGGRAHQRRQRQRRGDRRGGLEGP